MKVGKSNGLPQILEGHDVMASAMEGVVADHRYSQFISRGQKERGVEIRVHLIWIYAVYTPIYATDFLHTSRQCD